MSLRKTITDIPWRLIIDGPQSASWNMSVDEALLTAGHLPTVRFYSWENPTVSYGYFQNHDDFQNIPNEWSRVRRLTGGGAIVHHHEITYSITGSQNIPLLAQTNELYLHVHRAWQTALSALNVTAHFRNGERHGIPPKWCFSKGDPYDLVSETGLKLLGSAQRRSQKRVLLHGSLPLKPQSLMGGTGLEACLDKKLEWDALLKQLLPSLKKALNISWSEALLSPNEKNLAEKIQKHRYSDSQWVESRFFPSFA